MGLSNPFNKIVNFIKELLWKIFTFLKNELLKLFNVFTKAILKILEAFVKVIAKIIEPILKLILKISRKYVITISAFTVFMICYRIYHGLKIPDDYYN